MDRASQALATSVPPDVPKSYRALADYSRVPRSTLHHRACGRRSIEEKAQSQQYLRPWEEDAVVKFLLQMSDLGQPVRIKDLPSLAFSATSQRPHTDQPFKPPSKNWARAFEKRHPECQARRVRALDWNRHEKNTYVKIKHWFETIGRVLQDPSVLAENVYNMDETGVMLSMPGSTKVLVGKNDIRDYRGAQVKRTTITAIECISGDGRYLNPMIIWPASTHRSNWTTFPTPGWQYACSESGYTDSHISLQWLTRIFDPETKERANQKPRVLICDGFCTHETLEILEYCFLHNIVLCRLPSHTSHKLQPCDVAVFSPLKAAYREQVERLERGGVNTIGKEHFTSLFSAARQSAFSKKNIKAGFAACGLFPFNPDRVLRDTPKPPANLAIPNTVNRKQIMCPQDALPETPVTPVSADGIMLIERLIIQQYAHTLDTTSKQSLQKHIRKLAKSAQLGFTENALQQSHIKFLTAINSEAKVRRSTRSLVLGTAKVMGYEELEEARVKRAKKEAAKDTNCRSRAKKRKRQALNTGESAVKSRLPRSIDVPGLATHPDLQIPETRATDYQTASEPYRAPVARMW